MHTKMILKYTSQANLLKLVISNLKNGANFVRKYDRLMPGGRLGLQSLLCCVGFSRGFVEISCQSKL